MSPPSSPAMVADVTPLSQRTSITTKVPAPPKLDNPPPQPSPLPSQGRSVVEHWSPASTARSTTPSDADKIHTPDPQTAVVARRSTHAGEPGVTLFNIRNPEEEATPAHEVGEGSTPTPPLRSREFDGSDQQPGRIARNILHFFDCRRQRNTAAFKVGPRNSAVVDAAPSLAVARPDDVRGDEDSKPPGVTYQEDLVIRHRLPSSRGSDEAFADKELDSPAVVAAPSKALPNAEGGTRSWPSRAVAAAEEGVARSDTAWTNTAATTVGMLAGGGLDQGLVLPCAPSDDEKVRARVQVCVCACVRALRVISR